jgi:hypothetical protein
MKWTIKKGPAEWQDDEGFYHTGEAWYITDGVTEYFFSVAEYPTEADAWRAWGDKLM